MKTVTLQNGRKVQISDESHDALERASKKRYKPEYRESYWCINSMGEVVKSNWRGSTADNFRYQNRNVFPSEGDAQAALDRLNKRNEILNRIEELNEGWEPDWGDFDQNRYRIGWNRRNNQFIVMLDYIFKRLPDRYYFKYESIGEKLIKEFGDDLKVLFE